MELIKYGREQLHEKIYEIIIWTDEQMLQGWKNARNKSEKKMNDYVKVIEQ